MSTYSPEHDNPEYDGGFEAGYETARRDLAGVLTRLHAGAADNKPLAESVYTAALEDVAKTFNIEAKTAITVRYELS